MSELVQVADAVVAALNAASLSHPLSAQRTFQPYFDLKDLKTLQVSVVPRKLTETKAARTLTAFEYEIDVGIQKRLAKVEDSEIDPLVLLATEIATLFRTQRLAEYPAALWVKTETIALPANEHLLELRQFTGVLTLTFRVIR